jgi:transposase-like protein
MGKRSQLSSAERTEVVLQLLRREEPASKLSRRHGISEQTLYRWRDEFIAAGKAGLGSGSNGQGQQRQVQQYERELAARDQVIGELTVANRVLKKLSGASS